MQSIIQIIEDTNSYDILNIKDERILKEDPIKSSNLSIKNNTSPVNNNKSELNSVSELFQEIENNIHSWQVLILFLNSFLIILY